MYVKYKDGWIEVFCGPMFAGKTEALIRAVKRLMYAKVEIQVFKASIDNRFSKLEVVSHDKSKVVAVPASCAKDVLDNLKPTTQVIVIDEIQFFNEDILKCIDELADAGKRIIVTGLDCDFRGVPFKIMSQLLPKAEFVHKLSAFCMVCGDTATKTQRIINGEPAKYSDPIILVGATDSYEARCRKCHIVKK